MSTKEFIKSLFIRDKEFLRALYDGPNPIKNKRLIDSATESQLDTLIKYLHYLSNGKIRISRESFLNIKKKKKFTYLKQNFEKQLAADNLIYSNVVIKKQRLLFLAIVFPDLLAPLFQLPTKK